MLSWIPILGPIVDGIVSVVKRLTDKDVVRLQTSAAISIAEINALAATTQALKDDIGIRLSRDIILFPVAVWTALTTWDAIVVHHWPNLVWSTGTFLKGSGLEFLPYAVMSFLFGLNILRFWKR